ncbi:MAG: TIGR00725 family protein [Nitrososphaeraceae archaeon]
MRKTQISVIGYNEDRCTPIAKKIAYDVGKEIGLSQSILICGGLGGVMESACKGAKDVGGVTVGILPQDDFFFANKFCDIVIPTGIGFSRDFIVATSCDGIIVVGGGVGTLTELTVGYMLKKKMIAITGSGGIAEKYGGKFLDERKRIKIYKTPSPKKAVNIIIT